MNNIVNMVNYYILHKNADDSVISYIKNKINNSNVEDLIIIQIELLYTDPSDKLVNELVSFINEKINKTLIDITLFDLASLMGILQHKKRDLESHIKDLENNNEVIYEKIKNKDYLSELKQNETESECVARLVDMTQDNVFFINRKKSEIKSLGIWLNNLENSFNKKIKKVEIKELLECYIEALSLINRDDYINAYINKISTRIDSILLHNNILEAITKVMPELDKIYKENSKEKNKIYKLLDYYIDLVDGHIKKKINTLIYEEKLILKEKINIITKEILENDNPDDDFKALVINSYLRYL